MQGLQNTALFKQACYVDGKWITAETEKSFPVFNPADGQLLGEVPDCTQVETKRAIQAAHRAFDSWRSKTAKERADILLKWSHLIDENKQDLARLMTSEQGKPLAESLGEIDYANSFIRWFAEEARRVYGDIIPSNKIGQHLLVIKQPLGVVAIITPWNFPTAMITRKLAPAIAAGCTVVVKPAEDTPFSALALAALAEEAGIPAGVINVVTGNSAIIGKEMTSNSLVHKLSFTGSTPVGRILMEQSAPTLKKLSLELGGNAPFIVFDDANLDAAVKGAIASKYRNTGQTCVCANRLFVQESVYDEFASKLKKAVKELKVGNGLDEGVAQGPLINKDALKKVEQHVADAKEKGGEILLGGKPHHLGGLFYEPTIILNANEKMRLATEETFGPVAPLFKFKQEEEVVQMANNTEFGLAAYFYSNNIDRIWRVAEALESGMVGINTGIVSTEVAPFGGIKQSGMGREGSKYGIEDYLEIKYLCMEETKPV